MADYPAMPLWTDAYLADTRHLSRDEHGAYLLLLMEAWRRPRCALPDDDALLSRLTCSTPEEWARIKPAVMAFWKYDARACEWIQKRLSKEHEFIKEKQRKNRHAAATRWGKTKKTDTDASSMQCKRNAPTPTPTPLKEEAAGGAPRAHAREDRAGKDPPPAAPSKPTDPMVERVVEAAQADVARESWLEHNVRQALRRWRALDLTDDEIAATVAHVAGKYPPGHAKATGFFDDAMARAAGEKHRPALQPIDGGRSGDTRAEAAAAAAHPHVDIDAILARRELKNG